MGSGQFDIILTQTVQSGGNRLKITDLSFPMFIRKFTFRRLRPGKVTRFLTLTYPFEGTVWLYTLATLVVVTAAALALNLTTATPVSLYQVG